MATIANAVAAQIQARKCANSIIVWQKQSPFPPGGKHLRLHCGQTTDKSVQRLDNLSARLPKIENSASESKEKGSWRASC
jgi:hypothetical protein